MVVAFVVGLLVVVCRVVFIEVCAAVSGGFVVLLGVTVVLLFVLLSVLVFDVVVLVLGWFNSALFVLVDLVGKVVLYDFWIFGCVNC